MKKAMHIGPHMNRQWDCSKVLRLNTKLIFARWNFEIKTPVFIRCSLHNYTVSTLQYQINTRNNNARWVENPTAQVCDMNL